MDKMSDGIYSNPRELFTLNGGVYYLIFDGSWWKDVVVSTDGLGNILQKHYEDYEIETFDKMAMILE